MPLIARSISLYSQHLELMERRIFGLFGTGECTKSNRDKAEIGLVPKIAEIGYNSKNSDYDPFYERYL